MLAVHHAAYAFPIVLPVQIQDAVNVILDTMSIAIFVLNAQIPAQVVIPIA
jgi:hypothetical protein